MNEIYEINCEACGQSISVTQEQSGIQFNCPSCSAPGVVPVIPAPVVAQPGTLLTPSQAPVPAPANTPQVGFSNVMSGVSPVNNVSGGNLVVTQTALANLNRGKGWVMFMAVISFLLSLLLVAVMFFLIKIASDLSEKGFPTGIIYLISSLYFIMSLIIFFQGLHLTKFSSASGRAAYSGASQDLDLAMIAQMKFWRLTGIVLILSVVLMLLMLAK